MRVLQVFVILFGGGLSAALSLLWVAFVAVPAFQQDPNNFEAFVRIPGGLLLAAFSALFAVTRASEANAVHRMKERLDRIEPRG